MPTPPAGSSGAPTTGPTSGPSATAGVPLFGTAPPPTPGQSSLPVPTSFSIARLGISMKVRAEGVAGDGQMALAPTPAEIGWYRYGSRPGDPTGATVLAGHLDEPDYGIGPLAQLTNLRQGDIITVVSGTKTRRYSVTSVTSIKKTALDLTALFTRVGPPQLHVVTCGGNFDQETHHYDANVVVIANPID
ncbi:MAG: class F sortase [Terracoccus sp.]